MIDEALLLSTAEKLSVVTTENKLQKKNLQVSELAED